MTDQPSPPAVVTLEYLLDLVTAEHNQQPRYMATVALSVQPYVDGQNAANRYWTLFDLDSSVGEQEDMLGLWVGITRYIAAPLKVFFTLDDPLLGFDQGKWQTPYELDQQIVRLDDEHYRLLLRARIVANQWDGTIPGAYLAWDTLFAGTGLQVLIQDGMQRAERYFSLDDVLQGTLGFDGGRWYEPPVLADIYFSLDDPNLALGLDRGSWYSSLSIYTVPPAVTHGDMHLVEALIGPALDAVTIALFAGGYMGLKSAGVWVDYVTQNQTPGPGYGVGLPLFSLDGGPSVEYWVSFDEAGLGHDEAPLFYPGAYPVEPGLPQFTIDGNDPSSGIDAGYWADPVEPDFYLTLDDNTAAPIGPGRGLDAAQWLPAGAYGGQPWRPWPYDPDQPLPPTGVSYPPTALAGFDLGGWAWQVQSS
jgi:hypothetical protein